ncbi:uncharacterized protein Z519_01697 [Cladophialophora bantiana CBS 173.52]|uniref:Uncharacterized protein n=1 Tax=Cladophialophora bantiana (strain ATCC 10958 / CBS 173.52 / CDC B-1940 / NIH 8579) TaxID=1442370 RepID=A0A0D2HXJ0_CLAB1|nr:uncharacterized protein Z519_01697 [Cladophialophora bantiana CBS 173.52]KIW98113.1 hypothetical protein Z519_01697 [Cladophialophora bantiana CBS 173.52]
MSAKTVTTFLLSSLVYSTTHAFVPLDVHPPIDNNDIQPLPSEFDTVHWIPIATLAPLSHIPSPASSVSTPTPSPLEEENEYHILPLGLDANAVPELKVRQVTGQGVAAAAPTAINQISPITTYYINSEVAVGVFTQVPVVYTQTFAPIPDQWTSAGPGTIGLGTISGTVGQVRSKRSLPTQAPLAQGYTVKEGNGNANERHAGGQENTSWMEKLKKAGKEMMELLSNKETEKPTMQQEEHGVLLDEDAELPATTYVDAVLPEKEQEKADLLLATNDARRAVHAGTLAVLAVGIATICVSYL